MKQVAVEPVPNPTTIPEATRPAASRPTLRFASTGQNLTFFSGSFSIVAIRRDETG
jgi:hypothetical protein